MVQVWAGAETEVSWGVPLPELIKRKMGGKVKLDKNRR